MGICTFQMRMRPVGNLIRKLSTFGNDQMGIYCVSDRGPGKGYTWVSDEDVTGKDILMGMSKLGCDPNEKRDIQVFSMDR